MKTFQENNLHAENATKFTYLREFFARYANEILPSYLDFHLDQWIQLVEAIEMLKNQLCLNEEQRRSSCSSVLVVSKPSRSNSTSSENDFDLVSKISSNGTTNSFVVPSEYSEPSVNSLDDSIDYDPGSYGKYSKDDFSQFRPLSGGGFGICSIGIHPILYKVVVKEFDQEISAECIKRELDMARRLQKNKNIVRLYGFYYESKEYFGKLPLGMVMEYMPHSLHYIIHERIPQLEGVFLVEYNLLQTLSKIRDMTSGFAALHAMNVIHRDIKPANILVTMHLTVKICDFGACCNVGATSESTIKGTFDYMSPEILRHTRENSYDEKTDVYSLGVTIWELFHRKSPSYEFENMVNYCCNVQIGKRPKITSSA